MELHGFATEKEIRETYAHIPYKDPEQWRAREKHLPKSKKLGS